MALKINPLLVGRKADGCVFELVLRNPKRSLLRDEEGKTFWMHNKNLDFGERDKK